MQNLEFFNMGGIKYAIILNVKNSK